MGNRLLVTGAAGFIGSHLCDALLAEGHRVIGIDSFTDYYDRVRKEANIAHACQHSRFVLEVVDLNHAELDVMLDGVDLVFHLAGQPGVRGSWGSKFTEYQHNNISATQRLLEAAVAANRTPVVFASSSSVYGNIGILPLREDFTPMPASPYGVTKLAAEHLCGLYSEVFGLATISLRLFTVYGPRQRPDMAFQRFFAAICQDRAITVYGDGSQTRDFTYVGDVIRAFQMAGENLLNGPVAHPVFNVAGGSRVKLRDVVELLYDVSHHRRHIINADAQPGDVRNTWADISRAQACLGFTPTVALIDGLKQQWTWYCNQL